MKNKSFAFLLILALGALCWIGLPWWTIVPVGFLVGIIVSQGALANFGTGFSAGSVLWYAAASWLNSANLGVFSNKIGQIFMGLTPVHLLLITAGIGGILAGMGALTGYYFRLIFVRSKPKRHYGRKYY
jgi:hypothetical protein